ncbi:Ig-like domain-containing protein [Ideonella paludis]|uniref:Ig-like domain-containing protein n=1 Tax=Ideonella paludis TaxID=1233411 RepID=UPI0036283685
MVTAQITDTSNKVSPMAEDRVIFNGNFSPIGSDDAAPVRALAAPVATFLAMSQDSGSVLPGGQTWRTSDGDAGRGVYGLLTDLLAPGMKVQVSSSDHPGVWFDAVISADGRHWTAVDAQAHNKDWTYNARVVDASGQAVSPTVSQDVIYEGGEAKAPTIEGFDALHYSPFSGYLPIDSQPAIGSTTDATRLAIKGHAANGAASAGNTITVYDNGTDHPIGSTTVQADGSWILDLRDSRDFANGGRTHNFYAQETNASGEAGAWSNKADLKIVNQAGTTKESFAYMDLAAANSSGTHTGSLGTIDGSVEFTAISSDKTNNGVVDRSASVNSSFHSLWFGDKPTGFHGAAVMVSEGASLTLNFSKPVTDPNLFFQQLSADLSVTATDAKGNTFNPTLYQVSDNGSLGEVSGNLLLGAGRYGQGLIGLSGDIVSITLTQTGSSNPYLFPYFVQLGQRLPTVGVDPGADDGSITPGALVNDTQGNDVLSFASQAELDSALAQGLDAGAGTDTLRLSGSDMRLNLSLHSSTPGVAATLNNVERFELGTGARNTLEMSINDVLAQGRTDAFVANGKTQVMVNGDSSDTLSLTPLVSHGGDAGQWLRVGTVQVNGSSYVVFEHSALQAQVLAQQGLRVQVPAEPGTPAARADLPINTGNVLANDSDPDGRQADLRVAGVDNNPSVTPGENLGTRLAGQYGHLTLNADGSYSYVADKSFGLTAPAVDVFYYLPKDAEGQSAVQPSRLNFNVQPVQANVEAVSAPEAVVEGHALTYTVQTSDAAVPTALLLELMSGTATVGQDTQGPLQVNLGQGWVDVAGGLVTLPAQTTSFQVRVATVDDSTFEQAEALSLKVVSANGSSATGAGRVMDNDLSGTASGTEDMPLTLSWADFGLNQLAAALPKLMISALPADGLLQHEVDGRWRLVQVGEEVSRTDIDAGKLRFVPDGQESGVDAYQRSGVGNKLSDYAQFKFTAYGADGSTHTDSTMTIDIAPKADLGTLSLAPMQTNMAPNVSVFTLLVDGSSPDQDGSERLLVSFRVFGEVTVGSGPANPYWSPMTPDADGRYWAAPAPKSRLPASSTTSAT